MLPAPTPDQTWWYRFQATKTDGGEMIDFQTNTDQIEELKTAALMLGISLFSFVVILVIAVILITRWLS